MLVLNFTVRCKGRDVPFYDETGVVPLLWGNPKLSEAAFVLSGIKIRLRQKLGAVAGEDDPNIDRFVVGYQPNSSLRRILEEAMRMDAEKTRGAMVVWAAEMAGFESRLNENEFDAAAMRSMSARQLMLVILQTIGRLHAFSTI